MSLGRNSLFFKMTRGTKGKKVRSHSRCRARSRSRPIVIPLSPPTSLVDEVVPSRELPSDLDEDLQRTMALAEGLRSETAKKLAATMRARILEVQRQRRQQSELSVLQSLIASREAERDRLQQMARDEEYGCYAAEAGQRDLEKTVSSLRRELESRRRQVKELRDEHQPLVIHRERLQSMQSELKGSLTRLHASYEKKLTEMREGERHVKSEEASLGKMLKDELDLLEDIHKQQIADLQARQRVEEERLVEAKEETIRQLSGLQRDAIALKSKEDSVQMYIRQLTEC